MHDLSHLRAAAAGNRRAIDSMAEMEKQQTDNLRRQAVPRLTDPAQLPEFPNEPLHIIWDIIDADECQWHHLTHRAIELWRELALYEFDERYREVFAIVDQRYGSCFASMHPTDGANNWLVGDSWSANSVLAELKARLDNDADTSSAAAASEN